MNTKNKSLKENFGYLFEEEEAKSGESSGQKLAITFPKELEDRLSGDLTEQEVLAFCMSIDFLLLKDSKSTDYASSSFLNTGETLQKIHTQLTSQKSEFKKIFMEFTAAGIAENLLLLYTNGIEKLSANYTKIIFEQNLRIKKVLYSKTIELLLRKYTSNAVNLETVFNYFLMKIDQISSLGKHQDSTSSDSESQGTDAAMASIKAIIDNPESKSYNQKDKQAVYVSNEDLKIGNNTIKNIKVSQEENGNYPIEIHFNDSSTPVSAKISKSDLGDQLSAKIDAVFETSSEKESTDDSLKKILSDLRDINKRKETVVEDGNLIVKTEEADAAVVVDLAVMARSKLENLDNITTEKLEDCLSNLEESEVQLYDTNKGEFLEASSDAIKEMGQALADNSSMLAELERTIKENQANLLGEKQEISEEQQTQVDQLANEEDEVVNKNTVDNWENLVKSDLVKSLDTHFYSSNPLQKTLTKGFEDNQLDFEKIKQNNNVEIEKFKDYLQKNMNAISTNAIKSEISNVYRGEIQGLWDQSFKGKKLNEQAFESAFISTCMSAYDSLTRGGKSLSEGFLKKAGILLGGAALIGSIFYLASSFVAVKVGLSAFSLIMSGFTIVKYKKAQKAYKKDPISYIESLFSDKQYVGIAANLIKALSADSLIELACPTHQGATNRSAKYSESSSKFKEDETAQKEVYTKLTQGQKNNARELHKKAISAMKGVKYFEKGLVTISMLNYVFDEFMFGKEGINDKTREILLSGDDESIQKLFEDKDTQEQLTEKLTTIFKEKTGLESKFTQWAKSYNLKMRKEKSHIKQRGFRGSSQMVNIMGEKFPGFSVLRSRSMMNKEYFEHMIREITGISRESAEDSKALDTQSLSHLDAQAAKDARGSKNENRYYNMSLASLLFENESQQAQGQQRDAVGFGQGNELGVEDPDELMTPRGAVDLTQGPDAPGTAETVAATAPFIPLFFLPWFLKTKTIADLGAKNVWHYAHNASAAASLQKGRQDIIHTMFEWKGKIYTFYYYSEAALAGKPESLSLIITNTTQDAAAALAQVHSGAAAAGETAVLGKATALTDSDMVYHGSKLVDWLKAATVKGGRLDGAIEWAEKKGTVKLVGGKLIGAGTPDFLKVLTNITTTLRASTSVTEQKMILIKASVGAFSYTNAEIFATSSPDTVPKLLTGISDMMAKVEPNLSQTESLKLTTEYAGQILQSAGIKISGPMPSFGEGFQQGMNAGDYFNQYWSKLSAGQSEQWIQKTTKSIVKLTGQDAQEGLNLGVMQSKIPGTAGFQYKDIDWTSLGVSMLSLAAIAALIYRTAEGRRNYGAVNSNRFLRILNMPRFAAWDFFCSLFGQSNSSDYQDNSPDLTDARISSGSGSYELGGQSVTEPSLEGMGQGEIQSTSEPSFDAPGASTEARPQQSDGHFRESYHRLRMSDFLFEGVKTKNKTSKDKDNVSLAHQRLQSQFRNMFK